MLRFLQGMSDMAANVPVTDEVDEVIVDCVAFFYEEGKGGENFRKKTNEDEACEEADDSDESQNEFDESSDEDVEFSTDNNNSQGQQDELGTSTNFLFGARSRYGRAVRFNNRLLF